LHIPVLKLAFGLDFKPPAYIRKKACLCLYSFFKRYRALFNPDHIEKWAKGFVDLLENKNYGLLLSACSLIHGVIGTMGRSGFERIPAKLIVIMSKINDYSQDYYYYMTPCPWLQIKIIKIL
jgi:AP-2 complex subunit alpha